MPRIPSTTCSDNRPRNADEFTCEHGGQPPLRGDSPYRSAANARKQARAASTPIGT